MSSVRYGTRLGDLKNKQPTHTGIPLFTTWDSMVAGLGPGEPQYLKTFRAGADPGSELSHLGLGSPHPEWVGRVQIRILPIAHAQRGSAHSTT